MEISSSKKVLVDFTTSWMHREAPPVGIIRCEHEIAGHIIANFADQAIFGTFDNDFRGFRELSLEDVRNVIERSASSGANIPSPTATVSVPSSSSPAHVGRQHSRIKSLRAGILFANYLAAKSFGWKKWAQAAAVRAKNYLYQNYEFIDFNFLRSVASRMPSFLRPTEAQLGLAVQNTYRSAPPPESNIIDMATVDSILIPGVFWEGAKAETISREKLENGNDIKIFLLLYDLIPIVVRQFAESGAAQNFSAALHDLIWSCDHYFAISNSTANDVRQYAASCGYPEIRPEMIDICSLGPAKFLSSPAEAADDQPPPSIDHLAKDGFALFVSTIEPRKNHHWAYLLWRRLVQRNGERVLPLVVAGTKGWSSSEILRWIDQDPTLDGRHIVHVDRVSDSQLRWLYRNCAFTIFPSHYEGYGMTVAESLAFGKPCIASTGSSIEEAGQGLADHIDLLDGPAWISKIETYMFDRRARAIKQKQIEKKFVSFEWRSFSAKICSRLFSARGS